MKTQILMSLILVSPRDAEGVRLLDRMCEARPPAFRGDLNVERIGKRVESTSVLSGPMVVRSGEAMSADLSGSRNLRLLLAEGRLVAIRGRSRTARVSDLSRADRFHPLELWVAGGARLGERFRVSVADDEGLPHAVSGSGGRPLEPAQTRRRAGRSLAVAGTGGAAPRFLTLVPRNRDLARRIRWIRMELDSVSLRLRRVVVDGPYAREEYRLTEVRSIAPPARSEFEIDLSPFNVEER